MFPDQKPILEGAFAITSTKSGGCYEFFDVPTVNFVEHHRPVEALRVLVLASHTDKTFVKSPVGGIVNIALADPSSVTFDPETRYLFSTTHKTWVLSSLVGQTTHFSAGTRPQICVAPSAHGWHRLTALLAKVCNHNVLYFQSFRDGVTFSASSYDTSGLAPAEKSVKGVVAPIMGSLIPRTGRIPVFDGRKNFRVGNYWEHPYSEDVPRGSTVMLLFSIRKGKLGKAVQEATNLPTEVDGAIYLNILGIVVLEEPAEQFSSRPSQEGPEAFGVDKICSWAGAEEVGDVDDVGNIAIDVDDPIV